MRRLLIRPGAIGDFIASLPALEALAGDEAEVWCAEQNVPLVRFVARARSIGSAGLDRLGLLPADDVIERLRGFDSVVSWYGTKNEAFRETVRALGLPFTFLNALPGSECHAVEYYRQQAISLGANNVARVPRIEVPECARTEALIHPFASSAAKRAPITRFEAIAVRLAQQMPVRWLAGPEEALDGALRIPDLYDLAGVLRGARIFVGNDSGIGHLAAAVGTPVLALFRSTDARVWVPRGTAVDVARLASA